MQRDKLSKNLVVIIPGYELAFTDYPNWIVTLGSRLLGLDTNAAWLDSFASHLRTNTAYDFEIFKWRPGVTRHFALQPAADNLAVLLQSKEKYKNIVLFGKSLGGIIAQLALQEITSGSPIHRLLYVATPHGSAMPGIPRGIEEINIYSKADWFSRAANIIYNFSTVSELTNAINIELPGITHTNFNHNIEVTYGAGKICLYDLYTQLICRGKIIENE